MVHPAQSPSTSAKSKPPCSPSSRRSTTPSPTSRPTTSARRTKRMMRIYRDTRFDASRGTPPRPYKTNVAAWWSRAGLEKTSGAGFYFHFSPKETVIAAGIYMPTPAAAARHPPPHRRSPRRTPRPPRQPQAPRRHARLRRHAAHPPAARLLRRLTRARPPPLPPSGASPSPSPPSAQPAPHCSRTSPPASPSPPRWSTSSTPRSPQPARKFTAKLRFLFRKSDKTRRKPAKNLWKPNKSH